MYVCYEVTLTNDTSLDAALDTYMTKRHISDIVATHCFHAVEYQSSAPGRSRTLYYAPDQGALDRYVAQVAPAMRADFTAHFPQGIEVSRTVWTVEQRWA